MQKLYPKRENQSKICEICKRICHPSLYAARLTPNSYSDIIDKITSNEFKYFLLFKSTGGCYVCLMQSGWAPCKTTPNKAEKGIQTESQQLKVATHAHMYVIYIYIMYYIYLQHLTSSTYLQRNTEKKKKKNNRYGPGARLLSSWPRSKSLDAQTKSTNCKNTNWGEQGNLLKAQTKK